MHNVVSGGEEWRRNLGNKGVRELGKVWSIEKFREEEEGKKEKGKKEKG